MTLNDLIEYLTRWRDEHPGSGIQSVGVSVDNGEWHARLTPPLIEKNRNACADLEFEIP